MARGVELLRDQVGDVLSDFAIAVMRSKGYGLGYVRRQSRTIEIAEHRRRHTERVLAIVGEVEPTVLSGSGAGVQGLLDALGEPNTELQDVLKTWAAAGIGWHKESGSYGWYDGDALLRAGFATTRAAQAAHEFLTLRAIGDVLAERFESADGTPTPSVAKLVADAFAADSIHEREKVEREAEKLDAMLAGSGSDSPEAIALHLIWKQAGRPVLNAEDAQQRHQMIYDIASRALVDAGVLDSSAVSPSVSDGETCDACNGSGQDIDKPTAACGKCGGSGSVSDPGSEGETSTTAGGGSDAGEEPVAERSGGIPRSDGIGAGSPRHSTRAPSAASEGSGSGTGPERIREASFVDGEGSEFIADPDGLVSISNAAGDQCSIKLREDARQDVVAMWSESRVDAPPVGPQEMIALFRDPPMELLAAMDRHSMAGQLECVADWLEQNPEWVAASPVGDEQPEGLRLWLVRADDASPWMTLSGPLADDTVSDYRERGWEAVEMVDVPTHDRTVDAEQQLRRMAEADRDGMRRGQPEALRSVLAEMRAALEELSLQGEEEESAATLESWIDRLAELPDIAKAIQNGLSLADQLLREREVRERVERDDELLFSKIGELERLWPDADARLAGLNPQGPGIHRESLPEHLDAIVSVVEVARTIKRQREDRAAALDVGEPQADKASDGSGAAPISAPSGGAGCSTSAPSEGYERFPDPKTLRRQITGALRSTIEMHGPVTRSLIESATKRIARQIEGVINDSSWKEPDAGGTQAATSVPDACNDDGRSQGRVHSQAEDVPAQERQAQVAGSGELQADQPADREAMVEKALGAMFDVPTEFDLAGMPDHAMRQFAEAAVDALSGVSLRVAEPSVWLDADRIHQLADWLGRDRREPDKVLLYVRDLRRLAERVDGAPSPDRDTREDLHWGIQRLFANGLISGRRANALHADLCRLTGEDPDAAVSEVTDTGEGEHGDD